mgnify:CR=1 FL=1
MNYKYILTISLVLTQVACASAKLSCDQSCALDGMWCEGMSRGTAYSHGGAYDFRRGSYVVANGSTQSAATFCRKPVNEKEAAKIAVDQASGQEEIDSTANTNLWITVGSILAIPLLGVVTYPHK